MSAITDPVDRIAQLEARIAELERPRVGGRQRLRLARRLALIGLVVLLIIPAGAVLASHQYDDVPTSHRFHAHIDAITDARLTFGCGGNNFCPDGLVTRGQMAAFLNRLGALTGGSRPVVNADRVDDRNANELTRVGRFTDTPDVLIPNDGDFIGYGNSIILTAPVAGFVTVSFSVTVRNQSCTVANECHVRMRVLHNQGGVESFEAIASVAPGEVYDTVSVHTVFEVEAGTNSFEPILARSFTSMGDGVIRAHSGTGTAMFTEFGPTGTSSPFWVRQR